MKDLNSQGLRVKDNELFLLDQTRLPDEELWLNCKSPEQMIEIIKSLRIRGAPLIGVGAAVFLAIYYQNGATVSQLREAAAAVRASRPTAVNLMTIIDRLLGDENDSDLSVELIVERATKAFEEDVALCEKMAQNGLPLIEQGDNILTHCNAGGIATVGIGTSIGVIRKAHEAGLNIHVYVDETRPLLQGARLTTWELDNLGIPNTLICDNTAASMMARGKIQKVFLGADRVALNGDFANKIGTYSVAVCAKHHNIPFYTVAPYTTLDKNAASGADIPVEERAMEEVQGAKGCFGDVRWAPANSQCANPAFDVTPVELLSGIVMDAGYFDNKALRAGVLKEL